MQRSSPRASPSGPHGPAAAHAPASADRTPAAFAEAVGPTADTFEREADRVAAIVVRGPQAAGDNVPWAAATATAPRDTIQRAPRGGPGAAPVAEAAAPIAETAGRGSGAAGASREIAPAAPASQPATSGLIVDDEAQPGDQQLRKTEFLAALRVEVCAAVDGALAGTGRDSQGCPWIDHWLGYYEGRSPSQIERSLFGYAPEARAAKTARAYIPFVAARVRRSAQRFSKTGEITGVPQDVPGGAMAGGGMLAAFGGMFFKARPGGARAADPVSIRTQLGGGQPLSGAVRGRMESAFGTNFGGVRVHTDAEAARLSNQLNARAFTIGDHVAFGGGEFQPGSIAGDALIAHELAHVVQQGQGHGEPPVGPLHKGGQPYTALEHDADAAATSVVTSLWSGVHGRTADIRRTTMPRLRSGLRLQRCGGSDKKVGSAKEGKLSPKALRDSSIQEANTQLRAVNTWAHNQVAAQDVKDKGGLSAVKNLDPKQAENVAAAVKALEKAQSLYGIKEMEALPKKLDQISDLGKKAVKESDKSSQYAALGGDSAIEARQFAQKSQITLGEAVDAGSAAAAMVTKLGGIVDVSTISDEVNGIVSTLNGIQAGKLELSSGMDAVEKKVKEAKKQVRELTTRYAETPEAIGRIIFVLKSFLALNAPKLTTAPSADDVKKYKAASEVGLSGDFNTVFGEGKATTGFDVFVAYGRVLDAQLEVRAKMEERGGKPASPIPSQGDAEALFTALKPQPNDEVLPAWTTYATAYFYHRVLDSFGDMKVTSVSEFYKRDLSIFGTRPLVCTGYAMLGGHLLKRAGATLTNFRVVFHATEDDLLAGQRTDGHAVTEMTRKGKTFWVSNHLIAPTLESALDVAWNNPTAPVFQATAKDINAASKAANAKMDQKTNQLKAKKKK